MGCCVSTGRASSDKKAQNFPAKIESFHQKPNLENRAPPPSFEEVTVKEVLSVSISEIPKQIPPPPVPKIEEGHEMPQEEKPAAEEIHKDENFIINKVSLRSPASTITTQSAAIDESEDVSEICSLSESISTTTITEKRDDGEEVTQRVSRRSLSPARMTTRTRTRDSVPRRDRVVGRPDPSPRRRNTNAVVNSGSVKTVRNRDPGQPVIRRGSRPALKQKDPGEMSGRRSRSPAVQRSVAGRTQSPKRANPSPARVRAEKNEIAGNSRKLEEKNNSEGKFPVSQSSALNESFDNPHVSLECFIFL